MFIPIGFGQWPRIFPWAVAAIAIICLIWSILFFPTIHRFEKDARRLREDVKGQFSDKIKAAMFAACKIRLKDSEACGTLNEKEKSAMTDRLVNKQQKFIDLIKLTADLRTEPRNWPDDVKNTPEFRDLERATETFKSNANNLPSAREFTRRSNANIYTISRATFTHSGWLHLLGNMFFLIIFGCWVEQRVGRSITALTFIAGSFLGMAIQMAFHPNSPVLGASAGVSAVMGSFLLYFFRAEFQFLFTFGGLYFRRIWMPLLWIFPSFYLISDFTATIGREDSGIAHLAHLGGLLIGVVVGFLVNRFLPLPKDVFFFEEEPHLRILKKSTELSVLIAAFQELVRWNSQNWKGTELFLTRINNLSLHLDRTVNHGLFERQISNFVSYHFRRGALEDMLRALSLASPHYDLLKVLENAPLSLLLHLADHSAQRNLFKLASLLYRASIPKAKDEQHKKMIQNAIIEIGRRNEPNYQGAA